MKNPFPTNPSPGDIFLAGPVRISQIHGERSPRIWTLEKCRYAAHAIETAVPVKEAMAGQMPLFGEEAS